ncbi:hypothetical protein Tco_0917304 [Tanacetum coccineum]
MCSSRLQWQCECTRVTLKETSEFWREVDILLKLHHSNVMEFYSVVQDGLMARSLLSQCSWLWLTKACPTWKRSDICKEKVGMKVAEDPVIDVKKWGRCSHITYNGGGGSEIEQQRRKEEENVENAATTFNARFSKLDELLSQTKIYSDLLLEKMDEFWHGFWGHYQTDCCLFHCLGDASCIEKSKSDAHAVGQRVTY